MNMFSLRVLLILAALTFTVPTLADQLKMKNGDVITGEVKKIEDGELFIEPAYGSEFSVDLAEIASVETEQVFEVELESGEKIEAAFASGEDGNQTMIVDDSPRMVAMTDFAEANELEEWYDRASHVDVNMTQNSGNTDSSNWLIFADTILKLGDHRHLGELTFGREKRNGETTKKQDLFNYEYNWLFNGPWYLGAGFSYERDPIKELDHRYTAGLGIGRDLIDNSDTFLTANIGMGWSEEQIQALPAKSGATVFWNLRYTQDLFDGDIDFYHNHSINYQLYAENNMIFKSNTGLQFDLIDDIFAKISLRYDYETEPAQRAQNNDATLAIGIGAEF